MSTQATAGRASSPQPPNRQGAMHGVLPFVRGGVAGVLSWLVIHPADVIKVRMQLANTGRGMQYRGVLHAAQTISRNEGVSGMYSGLSAALTRQVTYTTMRLGLYGTLRDKVADADGRVSMAAKFGVGTAAGGIASAISTPVEVAMVRMYSDGAAESGQRRGYRNIADALWRIGREEGVFGLWSGASPTIVRSMVANCVQLGAYDQAKEFYLGMGWMREGVGLHVAASTTSGFMYSLATLPIDSAKTRMQNQRMLEGGGRKYKSLGQTITVVAREEGVLALWRGFLPYFSRCAGHTVAMFLVLEQVKKIL